MAVAAASIMRMMSTRMSRAMDFRSVWVRVAVGMRHSRKSDRGAPGGLIESPHEKITVVRRGRIIDGDGDSLARNRGADNGFMGHYGYLITMPETYTANPKFVGEIEKTDIYPKACAGHTRAECDQMGLVELAVLTKRFIAKETGMKDFKAYTDDVLNDAKKAGSRRW